MQAGYVVLSAMVTLLIVGVAFYYSVTYKFRTATPAWLEVARALGGEVARTPATLSLVAVVDGRPLRVATVTRGRGRLAQLFTVVAVASRHPDAVLAGQPVPEPTVEAWKRAWDEASRAANESSRRIPSSHIATRRLDGVVQSAGELRDAIDAHLATIRARETRIIAWRSAAAELGLTMERAYQIEGRWRDRDVEITADLVAATVKVHAKGGGHPDTATVALAAKRPDGLHHLDEVAVDIAGHKRFVVEDARATERLARARPALQELSFCMLLADESGAALEIEGVGVELERWRSALDAVTAAA